MFYGSCLFTMAFAFPMFVCHSMGNRALRRDTGDRHKGSGSARGRLCDSLPLLWMRRGRNEVQTVSQAVANGYRSQPG